MLEILARLRHSKFVAAVVLGDPDYYPRFGFTKASTIGLLNEYGVDDPFMAVELMPDGLTALSGLVRFVDAFRDCSA